MNQRIRRFLPVSAALLAVAVFQPTYATAQGADPDINKPYLSEKLDTRRMTRQFEDEGREAYERRLDVMKVLGLKPGDDVADIGAGSGFYVELMAQAVGKSGAVYAIEIAPNWIKHLRRMATEKQLTQVTVIEGEERSTRLPPASIDLAFSSDTYHHFEYPQDMLADIYQALRPGGRWVVLDYERIPGVSSQWTLDHVRAGKQEVIEEIVAAGFELEREADIGMHENYLLIFRRPKQ